MSRIVSSKLPPRPPTHLPKQRTRPTIILGAIQAAWSASILVATGIAIIFNANEKVAERCFILSTLEKALFVNGTSKNRMGSQ